MISARSMVARVGALLAVVVSLALPSTALAATVDYRQSSSGKTIPSGIFYGNNLYNVNTAAYGVYDNEACTDPAETADGSVAKFFVNYSTGASYGTTGKLEMIPGTYYVKEYPIGANNTAIGYKVDPDVYRVELTTEHTEEHPAVVKSKDAPITTTGTLKKFDKTTRGLPQGTLRANGLAGAIFRLDYFDNVTYTQAQANDARGSEINAHHKVWLFKTNDNGTVNMDDSGLVGSYTDPDLSRVVRSSTLYKDGTAVVWPLGTYLMTEIKAPDAYEFPVLAERQQIKTIRQSGERADSTFDFGQGNEVKKIDIQMEKRDAEAYADRAKADYLTAGTDRAGDTDGKLTQGDTKHDAHYLIYNVTGNYVAAGQPSEITYTAADGSTKTVQNNGLVDTINVFGCRLAADGKTWETQKVRLPASGVYKIVEDPNYEAVGMHNDPNWFQIVQPQPKTDPPNKLYRFMQTNIPKRYGIFIFKVDADTNTPIINILNDVDYEWIDEHLKKGQGDATLVGAEFEIINESDHSVRDKKTGKWFAKGEVVTTITTYFDAERNCTVAHTDIDELPYGRYRVRESKAPEGYKPLVEDIGGANTKWQTPVDNPESYVVVGWNRYDEGVYGGRTPDVNGHELNV